MQINVLLNISKYTYILQHNKDYVLSSNSQNNIFYMRMSPIKHMLSWCS